MGFLTPKSSGEDERLPGSGLHLDADPQRCPSCRVEVAPWQARCATCGREPVPTSQLPAQDVDLPPGLASLAADVDAELADAERGDGDTDEGSATDATTVDGAATDASRSGTERDRSRRDDG